MPSDRLEISLLKEIIYLRKNIFLRIKYNIITIITTINILNLACINPQSKPMITEDITWVHILCNTTTVSNSICSSSFKLLKWCSLLYNGRNDLNNTIEIASI